MKLAVLAVLALGAAFIPETSVLAATCPNGNCAIQQPADEQIIRREPQGCTGSDCALPTPRQKVACRSAGCAVDQPTVITPCGQLFIFRKTAEAVRKFVIFVTARSPLLA